MANPDLILIPFAQDGDKNTIPLELGIGDPVYRASLKVGFPPDTRIPKDIGGEPPDGLDFNGILNVLSQAIVFMQKGNGYRFDSNLAPYPIGALVRSNDDLTTFQNIEPLNSNNPNSNMTGWRVYNGSGFIVDNLTTNDSAKALSAAQGKVLQDNKLESNKVGAANGVASLDANTKVPVAQLPNASITNIGAVQLNNTLTSVSTTQAVTAAQAKVLGDRDFGIGQTYQDVTSSKIKGVLYTNNTKRPIQIIIEVAAFGGGESTTVEAGGLTIASGDWGIDGMRPTFTFIVPAGETYRITGNTTITRWVELS
jgi:hypothetical protein